MAGIQLNQYPGINNNYIPNLHKVQEVQTAQITPPAETQEAHEITPVQEEQVVRVSRANINPLEVSIAFRGDEGAHIGTESDVKNLDMQKAISDMQKDSILEEYSYFVGSTAGSMFQSADGMVFLK